MTGPLDAIADEAYARINCYGIGRWLENLYQRLGQALPATPEPWEMHSATRASGLIVTIYRQANLERPPATPEDALVLAKVEGDATAPMPRGLDAATETPQTATTKLSAVTEGGAPEEVARGDTRISYFIPDGKVVELRFNRNLVGFDRIVLVGLGTASLYRP